TVGVGTYVHPAGTVGVVVHSPTDESHAYRVRLPDGTEATFNRDELVLRKVVQRSGLARDWLGAGEIKLDRHVVLRCVIGSRAYGLDEQASDTDRRGVYLAPPEIQWSIYGAPE